MALQWDLSRCNGGNWKALTTEKRWPVTDTLIWYTMFTDIGWEVTEENAGEFYARIHVMERLGRPMLRYPERTPGGRIRKKGGKAVMHDYYITPKDVQSVIGLHVNVGPEPRLKWARRKVVSKPKGTFGKTYMDDFVDEYKQGICDHEWEQTIERDDNIGYECTKCKAHKNEPKES